MKPVGLCVDDFGFKPEVNEAVARLVDEGIVTVVGCMSTAPHWARGAALLRGERRPRVDVGLHLNLTERWPGGSSLFARPLPLLLVGGLLGALPRHAIRDAIERQLEAFEDAWGQGPDFVDGHQHVHQLPQVRDVLLDCLERRRGSAMPWLRCTTASPLMPPDCKQAVIQALGSAGLRVRARRRRLLMNQHLLGVYSFNADRAGYEQHLDRWLQACGGGDVLMMHPAVPARTVQAPDRSHPFEDRMSDVIGRAREVEYDVLHRRGLTLLQRHGVQPVRPSQHPELLRHSQA